VPSRTVLLLTLLALTTISYATITHQSAPVIVEGYKKQLNKLESLDESRPLPVSAEPSEMES
jgi:hypothetical protein